MTIFILKFIGVVVAIAFSDMCWAKYMIHVGKKNALLSAVWATMIMVGGMVGVISYVNDWRFIPAALIGAFIGTYYTVKHTK